MFNHDALLEKPSKSPTGSKDWLERRTNSNPQQGATDVDWLATIQTVTGIIGAAGSITAIQTWFFQRNEWVEGQKKSKFAEPRNFIDAFA